MSIETQEPATGTQTQQPSQPDSATPPEWFKAFASDFESYKKANNEQMAKLRRQSKDEPAPPQSQPSPAGFDVAQMVRYIELRQSVPAEIRAELGIDDKSMPEQLAALELASKLASKIQPPVTVGQQQQPTGAGRSGPSANKQTLARPLTQMEYYKLPAEARKKLDADASFDPTVLPFRDPQP